MDDKLVNVGSQQTTEVVIKESIDNIHINEGAVSDVQVNKTTQDVGVSKDEIVVVDMSESMGWVSGDNRYHNSLLGVDHANQHPIAAITGLRAELDEIERIKTEYSDKHNVANYYQWKDVAYAEHGYFVSIVPGSSYIKICEGADVFGVSVSDAGFVGGQDPSVKRDNTYGLIVTSGLVDVRCELDVRAGDYIIPNGQGCAKKAGSTYGYKVLARANKGGVEYAVISLGMQSDVVHELGVRFGELSNRVTVNETNITAAINLANQAYSKVNEIDASNKEMSDKVDGALGVVDKVASDMENFESQLINSSIISAQAKAIAESAVTSAESLRKEALEEANKAFGETSKLRNEFENKIIEFDGRLEDAAASSELAKEELDKVKSELQESINDTVEDMQTLADELVPLSTWPEGATGNDIKGVAGFVAKAKEDSATLATMVTWKGDAGDSLAGFVQNATENDATVKAIASYTRKDADGSPIGGGAAGLISQVDANQAVVQALAEFDGGVAGLKAHVTNNAAEITTLASKDSELGTAIAGVKSIAEANGAQLDAIANYTYGDKKGLAGLAAHVDNNTAVTSALAQYEDGKYKGISGLTAQVKDHESTISLLSKLEDGDITGLSGLVGKVNQAESDIAMVSAYIQGAYVVISDLVDEKNRDVAKFYYDTNNKVYYYYKSGAWKTSSDLSFIEDKTKVHYVSHTKLYWYYYKTDDASGYWKSTTSSYEAGLPAAIAGVQAVTDANSSTINSLTSWQGEANISMSRIEQKADANGAYMRSTVTNIDKYSVGPYSQSYNFNLDQAKSILTAGMIYVPTATHTETLPSNRTFTKEYYYTWDGEKWVASSSVAVKFSNAYVTGTTSSPYWYISGSSDITKDGITYNAHTLYKWSSYVGADGTTRYQWVAVATLEGNSQSRAVSQIRQDTNSIAAEVTDTRGNVASLSAQLTATESRVNTVAAWKDAVDDDVSKISAIEQKADANGANIALVVKDGKASGSLIIGAINGESTAKISADKLDIIGKKLNIKVDSTNIEGSVTAHSMLIQTAKGKPLFSASGNSVSLAGWNVDENSLYHGESFSSADVFICTGSGGSFEIGGSDSIKGWVLKAGKNFGVTNTGALYCRDACLTGEIHYGDGQSYDVSFGRSDLYDTHGLWVWGGNSNFSVEVGSENTVTCGLYNAKSQTGFSFGDSYGMLYGDLRTTGFGFISSRYTFDNPTFTINHKGITAPNNQSKFVLDISGSQQNSLEFEVYNQNRASGLTINNDVAHLKGTWSAASSIIVVSDARLKNSIEHVGDKYDVLFDALKPVRFKYNDGMSDRYHIGFYTQNVEEAICSADLTTQDFAAFVTFYKGTEQEFSGLRYEEFISLNTYQIQKLKERITQLEKKIEKMN